MFKKWVIRLADKWRIDEWEDTVPEPKQVWGGGRKQHSQTLSSGNKTPSHQRISHNYDDDGVITFNVYGATGGKIVEASRYNDKHDNERIKLYIIDENADFTESLAKIVTMEYLR